MATGMLDHVLRVLGINDCRPVGQQYDFRPDFAGQLEMYFASRGGLGERSGSGVAGRAARGDPGAVLSISSSRP